MKILGLDLSLNHFGMVALNQQGNVDKAAYLTDVKKFMKYFEGPPEIIPLLLDLKSKKEDKENFGMLRLVEVKKWIDIALSRLVKPDDELYISIEGYSYNSKSQSTAQIAELGGLIKHTLYLNGAHIRIHDPRSVKLFASNLGNASKKDMVIVARKSGFEIDDALLKRVTKKIKRGVLKRGSEEDLDGPGTDIADAFWLAQMLLVELSVRAGRTKLEDLSEGQRQVFLRTTKMFPENLLSRPFICKGN